jgi:hypothetical protein
MGLGWLGYTLGLWGYSLLRGYNVTPGQLMSPLHPYTGAWPPAAIPNTQVLPGKQQATQSTASTVSVNSAAPPAAGATVPAGTPTDANGLPLA